MLGFLDVTDRPHAPGQRRVRVHEASFGGYRRSRPAFAADEDEPSVPAPIDEPVEDAQREDPVLVPEGAADHQEVGPVVQRPRGSLGNLPLGEMVDAERDDRRAIELEATVAGGVPRCVEREEAHVVGERERRGGRATVVAPRVADVVRGCPVPDHVLVGEHEPLADHEPVGELVEGEDLRHPVDDVRLSDLLALENGNLLGELVERRRDRGMDLAGTEHGEVRARPHERAHERQGLYLRPRESVGKEASVDEDPRLGRPPAPWGRALRGADDVRCRAECPMDEAGTVEEREHRADEWLASSDRGSIAVARGEVGFVGREEQVVAADEDDTGPGRVERRGRQVGRRGTRAIVQRHRRAGRVGRQRPHEPRHVRARREGRARDEEDVAFARPHELGQAVERRGVRRSIRGLDRGRREGRDDGPFGESRPQVG